MNSLRETFDSFYDLSKPAIFWFTQNNPETGLTLFTYLCKFLYKTGLEKIVLDNSTNQIESQISISNAAGLNKNGEIPPSTLKYIGFDRVVVGTVTGVYCPGNIEKTRTKRFTKTESLVNWEGLPGIGAEKVVENLEIYGYCGVPITVNFAETPGKKGDEALKDLEKTMLILRDIPYIDRFELNISCTNVESDNKRLNERKENIKRLKDMLNTISPLLYPSKELYLKISPDITESEIDAILEIAQDFPVNGFTTTNTTIKHDSDYITESPEKGGASGNAVYNFSLKTQKLFYEKTKNQESRPRIIACGGINSQEKLRERALYGATEIQIYTPLIFRGTRLLRELRSV